MKQTEQRKSAVEIESRIRIKLSCISIRLHTALGRFSVLTEPALLARLENVLIYIQLMVIVFLSTIHIWPVCDTFSVVWNTRDLLLLQTCTSYTLSLYNRFWSKRLQFVCRIRDISSRVLPDPQPPLVREALSPNVPGLVSHRLGYSKVQRS